MVKDSRLSKVMIIFLGVTLLGSSFTAVSMPVFAAAPGTFIDDFVSSGSGGLDIPKNLAFGPDGNLYIISFAHDKVKRYDGSTGAYMDNFVTSGDGGLDGPQGLEFGPDDNLYVTSEYTEQVLRYDGSTGAFIDVFVAASDGLSNPQEAIFGPDGNLYVSNYITDTVVRFDGTSGSFMDVFVSAGSGGLDRAQGLEFGPDGNLYVASENTDEILRYNGATGAFMDIFATPSGMMHSVKDITFGPDGNLYATDNQHNHVERYDGSTGAKIDRYVSGGDGILQYPQGLVFGPDGNLYVTSENTDEILRYEGPFGVSATCNGVTATIVGTSSSEVIDGTSNDDVIVGLDGDDIINGMGGNDIICGDLGDDVITAGSGDDEIFGGDDNDTIDAGDGNNHVHGDSGNDIITTGSGNDDIDGNNGDDSITSGNGDDNIYGGNGIDKIDAGDGNNYVEGNNGSDEITTGSGVDTILGGSGDDCINSGGEAGDSIDGGSGTNLINTGSCTSIPTITISSPSDGDSFEEGTLITLSGNALDPEDDDLSSSITWTSDIHGVIGSGASISSSTAPIGFHIITASVTDSDGNIGSHSISMIVTPPLVDNPPVVSITSPFDGDIFSGGILVAFTGTASDPEDGDLTSSIIWNSNFDGPLGLGASTSTSSLTTETHVITASITDSDGNISTDSITVAIGAEELIKICHLPPGNPNDYHELTISQSALVAHVGHGDYPGKCQDDEEEAKKRAITALVKKQMKETRDKNELAEKRETFKEIKNELKDLRKVINEEKKLEIKEIVEDIKEVIKELKEDPEYDKEHKKIIKDEIKQIKREIVQEIKSDAKISKHQIDSKISELSKSDDPKQTAKNLGLDFESGKTQIAIELTGKDPAVVELLSSIGKIDAKDDNHVQLTISLDDLPKLRTIGGIENIRPPFTAVQFEEVVSEGVYFINADLAQFVGITGQGIKAAVLDLAFTDNHKISDNIVEVKSFRQGIGYLPVQGNADEALHGTAVAEIITDVAPDVQLYLYSMETDIEFASAVDEAISQQVDIIVMSAGWPNFPTDGTSHITKKIEHAVENGITFVVPAGNFANKHWEGMYVDSNANNWHEFSNSDEGLTISVSEERIDEEKPIIAHLMWDVGMSDIADFELVLVDPLGQIIAYSANEQKTKSDTPFEYIYHVPEIDGIYSIGILNAGDITNLSDRPSASLEIFSVNDELEYPITKSSVSVPADAQGAIVVGAVNHLDGSLEPFSSQGPTNNGMLAPHVVGPDGVSTLSLDGNPFFGTSATTPYIAGLAALIIQTNPDISPEQLLEEIQHNTDSSLFSLQNEFDYSYGYGSANAIFLVEEQEVLE